MPGVDVQPRQQVLVIGAGLAPALVGQRQHEGHGGNAQRQGRGARHRAGHVGDAIVHHAVNLVDRVLVGGGVAGLETAALINRHIDQRRAGFQQFQLRLGDQLGGSRTGDQHRADDQVGLFGKINGGGGIGVAVLEGVAEHIVKVAQAGDRAVEHRHIRAHPGGHLGGMGADHATAQHQHPGRGHAGHPAKQNAAPAIGLLQRPGPDLRCQLARHFRHRGQQRQTAAIIGHGLVGDAGDTRSQQLGGLGRIGREVQVGEQNLILAQTLALDRLRFLDLDDHLGEGKHLFGGGDDFRPGRDVIGVRKARAGAGVGLDIHHVAMRHGFVRGVGGDPDAEFLRLDFPGATDFHCLLPAARWRIYDQARIPRGASNCFEFWGDRSQVRGSICE